MNWIIKERGTGKTTELIKKSSETGYYIIVATVNNARNVSNLARSMNIDIPFPITVEEYLRGKMCGSYIKNVLIDDADVILETIFNSVIIDTCTLTK